MRQGDRLQCNKACALCFWKACSGYARRVQTGSSLGRWSISAHIPGECTDYPQIHHLGEQSHPMRTRSLGLLGGPLRNSIDRESEEDA